MNNKNFKIVKKKYINEIKSTLFEVLHLPTKSRIIHVSNEDKENVFSINFKTLPKNSSGVAHILEHTVLCGSKKFPVKDPFFSMTRRSLNTFMNAFTGPDFTLYPAASENEKDFYNLFSVYLDCAFDPLLERYSFMQEGHRLEFESITDINSNLIFKGVVYNEMKGALNSVDERLYHTIMKNLTPDLTYSINSGGDPKEIVTITLDELKDFHKKYYHPSNCIFYFYGNIPLVKHLDYLDKNLLKNYHSPVAVENVPKQKRFSAIKNITEKYPKDEISKDGNDDIISFTWLTTDIQNKKDCMALALLDSILAETDASILKKNMLKNNLCSYVDTIIDTDITEVPYTIICKGTNRENKDELEKVILNTFEQLIKTKLTEDQIAQALHQLEFSRLEISRNSLPYGLSLFMRAGLSSQHGGSFEEGLKITSLFKELRESLEDPSYIADLVKKYFLENKHRVNVTFIPSTSLGKQELLEEIKTLQKIKCSLTEDQMKQIALESQKLASFQKEEEKKSIECLPKIEIKDISRDIKWYPLNKKLINELNISSFSEFTNDILYLDLVYSFPEVDMEDIPYLSFLISIISETGTKNKTYEECLDFINLYLGDFGAYISINTSCQSPDSISPIISIVGKSFDRNAKHLIDFITEKVRYANFNEKARIKELVLQQYTLLLNSLNPSAMKYCISECLKDFSKSTFINNKLNGLPYFNMIKSIALDIDNKIDFLIEKLNYLQGKIFKSNPTDLVITSSEETFEKLKTNNFYSLKDMHCGNDKKDLSNITIENNFKNIAKVIPSSVSFTTIGLETINFSHEDSPYLQLATSILENKILHPLIREKGGAYGAGANYQPSLGIFYFHTYRDPQLTNSIKAIKTSIEEIAKGNFTEKEVTEAKMETIQDIDMPISPGKKGIYTYLLEKGEKTKNMLQKRKALFLDATKKDIVEAFKKHILPQKDKLKIVSFGSKEFFEKENAKFKTPLTIESI